MERITLITKPSKDYELIDSGLEEKLERFGEETLMRPDPQALWPKTMPQTRWEAADAQYSRDGREGQWKIKEDMPESWPIEIGGIKVLIKPTSFKHTGVFPEQAPNWEWLRETVARAKGKGREKVSVLNLFGYTGGASIAAAQAGAEVCHVDASKSAVAWAKENAELSGVAEKPIRWIIEDAITFVEREIKRGNRYDLILMDPPAFGHGPKDELWKFEEHFLALMQLCNELLSEEPLGMLINGYAAGYSASAFAYNLEPLMQKYGGTLQYGELSIEESSGKRLLPCGIFARWSRDD
jgi:23S rRNA (cytosine1962-C5)-methyltransferase